MSQIEKQIRLREELVEKLTEQMKTRQDRIDSAEARIEDLRQMREDMIVGRMQMQKEIDDMLTQITILKSELKA